MAPGTLAEYNDVKIISTGNTLSGKPRLDGHRISVIHIKNNAEIGESDDLVENALEAYPHLDARQVQAALKFVEEHPEVIEAVELRKEMIAQVMDECRQTCECTCGQVFFTLDSIRDHIVSEDTIDGEYRNPAERQHYINNKWYETDTVLCTCGTEFCDPWKFVYHMSQWYQGDEHLLETVIRNEP